MSTRRLLLALAVAAGLLATGHASAQTASQLYSEAVQNYDGGKVDVAKEKLRLALEIDKNFRPASILLQKIASGEKSTNTGTVSATSLAQVFLAVDFKDTTFDTAIETLRQRVAEKTGGRMQVNFVLQLPPDIVKKKVTLKLDHAPVTEILRYLASAAGVTIKYDPYAVTITPAPAPTAKTDQQPAVPASTP